MKRILLIAMLLISGIASAQLTTINPDTVCFGGSGLYQIPVVAGAIDYDWTVAAPGVITSGQGTNSITVDWSTAASGLIASGVSVIANTSCPSNPVDLDIFILDVVPTITQLGPFCSGDPCVTLVANPSGGIFTGSGVVAGEFCPNTALFGNNGIGYEVTIAGCSFTAISVIEVNDSIIIGPIEHD
jgi:hypothetical protein